MRGSDIFTNFTKNHFIAAIFFPVLMTKPYTDIFPPKQIISQIVFHINENIMMKQQGPVPQFYIILHVSFFLFPEYFPYEYIIS